jgi:hypothetical protein
MESARAVSGLLHRNNYGATVFLPPRTASARSGKASWSHVVSVTPRSRSLYFCTLPLSVVGSSHEFEISRDREIG